MLILLQVETGESFFFSGRMKFSRVIIYPVIRERCL